MQNGIYYTPLVDHVSSHQCGVLDAITGRESLSPVLIAAEEKILNDRYCEGYAAGCNIANQWE